MTPPYNTQLFGRQAITKLLLVCAVTCDLRHFNLKLFSKISSLLQQLE